MYAAKPAEFLSELSLSPKKKFLLTWVSFGMLIPLAAIWIGLDFPEKYAVIGMLLLAALFQYSIFALGRVAHAGVRETPKTKVAEEELSHPPSTPLPSVLVETPPIPSSHIPQVAAVRSLDARTFPEGFVIRGQLSGETDLILESRVEGAILLPGRTLVIGASAEVMANVTAGRIVVFGKVLGNVRANTIELRRSAMVEGDVVCERIVIEDGAFFKGGIDIRREATTSGKTMREEQQATEKVPLHGPFR